MSVHKFKVGQMVVFSPMRSGMPSSGHDYKIIRLTPPEDGNPMYRIKSNNEAFERVAKEIELKQR